MVYLLRHGLDDENFIGGHSDVSLTEEGVKQIQNSAQYIVNNLEIEKIYTSDIKRAIESAEIVNKSLKKEIIKDSNLRELDKGDLTGKDKSKLTKEEIDNLNTNNIEEKIGNGESMLDLYKRVVNLLKDDYFKNKDKSLIVTHRGIINMLYYYLNEQPPTTNKEQYEVTHGSIHKLNLKNKTIKKIY